MCHFQQGATARIPTDGRQNKADNVIDWRPGKQTRSTVLACLFCETGRVHQRNCGLELNIARLKCNSLAEVLSSVVPSLCSPFFVSGICWAVYGTSCLHPPRSVCVRNWCSEPQSEATSSILSFAHGVDGKTSRNRWMVFGSGRRTFKGRVVQIYSDSVHLPKVPH